MKQNSNDDARFQAILDRLANNKPSTWKLERAIWRAGELKISSATPLLIKLISTGEPLRDYCIAWALGWCGGNDAVSVLTNLYQNPSTPEFVQRIAFEALLKLSDAETKASLQTEMIEFLPPELRSLARSGSAEAFEEFAAAHPSYLFGVLDKIYQIDNEYVRPALLNILRTAPFQPNYFRPIRHIFKIAEYRHDAEVFAILAHRFERELGNFNNDLTDYLWNEVTLRYHTSGKRVYTEELQHPQPILAYSNQTQEYLRRRVWRTLKKLGEQGDRDYIKMAVAVLLQYSDADEPLLRRSKFDKWGNNTRNINHLWDKYADYMVFNHILYTNSPRYFYHPNGWRCQKGYKPGTPEPLLREEAFPELWEQHPEALLQLLLESECIPVHHFAVKALRACHSFCASLNINTIIQLVNKPDEVIAALGFELALRRYNPASPNQKLILILANRLFQSPPTQALLWMQEEHKFFLKNSNLIATLLTSLDSETRDFARKLLSSYILSDTTATILFDRLIAELLALTATETELAKDIAETLVENFTPQLRKLDLAVVLDLLSHPMLEIQEFGALIVIHCYNKAIASQLTSLYDLVRVIGIERLNKLGNEKLNGVKRNLIVAIAVNPNPEIRSVIKPIIQRLGIDNQAFNLQLASDFIEVLLTPEKDKGVHSFIVELLQELPGWMSSVSKETAFQLLAANSSAAQEVGGGVLGANYQLWTTELTTSEIVTMANHKIFSIREAAQQMFLQNLDHIRTHSEEMLAAVRLLDSEWKDSRNFALNIFKKEFSLEEFTPKVLVRICDSEYGDTIKLGRDLLTGYIQNIRRLGTDNPAFATQIISDFIELLLTAKKREGFFSYLVRLLWDDLQEWMTGVGKQTTFKLLKAESKAAQELGGLLLGVNCQAWISEFSSSEIVTLVNHQILSVREAARQMFLQILDCLRSNSQQMLATVCLLESQWRDSRNFAFRIFKTEFRIEDFTPKVLVSICDSASEDVRRLGRDLLTSYIQNIRHLATEDPALNLQVASDFIEVLLTPEKHEGVHSYVVRLLREELEGWMTCISKETAMRLLRVKSSVAQELGGLMLKANYQRFSTEFTTTEIVKLANHEIVAVREAAQLMFLQNLDRLRSDSQEMLAAVRMLEAKWDDSREFAFDIFTTEFGANEFTPQVLVSICDSVRSDARRLGRDLLTRNFQATDGEEYLLKFSEHPSADMQLFATNYLENYAVCNPDRLRELMPYFVTVLSTVNRSRVAKQRIFAFLDAEAQKSEEAARIVANIMTKQSVTMAIGDKAAAIQTLLKIHKNYPHIALPIQVKPVTQVRS